MKINKEIAVSLASKVAAQIQKANAEHFAKIEAELKNTKEYKKLNFIKNEMRELELKRDQLADDYDRIYKSFNEIIVSKSTNDIVIDTGYYAGWGKNKGLDISIQKRVKLSSIADDIIIEATFAKSGTCPKDLIEEIAKKYI